MPAPIDLTGHRYGRLVVLHKADQYSSTRKWVCICDCGTTKEIYGPSMRRGLTTSCGCYHKEQQTTHGEHSSRLYRIWRNMRRRCYGKNTTHYKEYGERGITVCPEWNTTFEPFKEWAENSGYNDTLSIDRIDDALTYSPSTCRWSTPTIQSRNQRSRKGSSSSYMGVHFQKELNKYRVRVRHDGNTVHVGVFETEEQAAKARDQYIKDNNLEGYMLNFK